jgi:hypothetical protein
MNCNSEQRIADARPRSIFLKLVSREESPNPVGSGGRPPKVKMKQRIRSQNRDHGDDPGLAAA